MQAYMDPAFWQAARRARSFQHVLGLISGAFLAVALVALIDGLLAHMRAGADVLDLLPGQTITVSGPSALKNPVTSDLSARFTPPSAPLAFSLDGFFAGYWFGNGMWRGQVAAASDATPGSYGLRVSFFGADSRAAQNFELVIHADEKARREASLSYIMRYAGFSPFILAAFCAALGVIFGAGTYYFGRLYAKTLGRMGMSEIFAQKRENGENRIFCLVPRAARPPGAGNARMVFGCDGSLLGEARVESWHKGRLVLTMLDGIDAPAGAVVCLRPPAITAAMQEREDGMMRKYAGPGNGDQA